MTRSQLFYREDLTDEAVKCRGGFNHSWDIYHPEHVKKASRGNTMFTIRCTRCSTTRHTEMASDGTWVGRHIYTYPERYRIDEKVKASDVRVEWLKRRKQQSRKRK